MKQIVSICTLFKNPGMDIFVKLGMEMIKDNIDFEMSCPFKKVEKVQIV